MKFKKAVVWGCQLHQHTNSYVYHGFHKAFKAMGYDAYWLNENSDVSGMDFADTVFLTEWQHAKNMPKRKDCKYILHNCDPKDYDGLHFIHLQTYTDFCRDATCDWHKHGRPEKLNDHGSWYLGDPDQRTIFQPWATDLLPDEINFEDADAPRSNESHWCGSLGGGIYGNENEIAGFRRACEENGVKWTHHQVGSTSFEENRRLIRSSYLAPAIQGTEQTRIGLPVCRVFKNVSYGQLAGTNCKASADLFGGVAVHDFDTHALFHKMRDAMNDKARIREAMRIVKEKHTYINRIESILEVL